MKLVHTIQDWLLRLQNERLRRKVLNRQLEQLTDPHFLQVAETVQTFEAANPQTTVTARGIERLRALLEGRQQ